MDKESEASAEQTIAKVEEMESKLDKEFLEEYNALAKKYKRTIAAALQIQRIKE